MKQGIVLALFAVLGTATTAIAADKQSDAQKQQSQPAAAVQPVTIESVETLLDNPAKYDNKRITIKGEVQDKIDSRTFVLESGGIINDEVVVVGGKDTKDGAIANLKEDANVSVTGTVRVVPIVTVRRELSWDLDPQIESELQGASVFVVADRIASR